MPADTSRNGEPIWYGGGKLAADLTLPKLRHRWAANDTTSVAGARVTAQERAAIWDHAAQACDRASQQIRSAACTANPGAAGDAAWAAADTLHAAAAALGSPALRRAAATYDRAGRMPYGRVPQRTRVGCDLRHATRLLSAAAFTTHDRDLARTALVVRLAALAESVAELRRAQARAAQAAAARAAAEQMLAVIRKQASMPTRPQATTVSHAAFQAAPGPTLPAIGSRTRTSTPRPATKRAARRR